MARRPVNPRDDTARERRAGAPESTAIPSDPTARECSAGPIEKEDLFVRQHDRVQQP